METEQNQGTKPVARAGDKIKLHYSYKLDDGTVFAASRDRKPL